MGPKLAVADAIPDTGFEVMTNAAGGAGSTLKVALVAEVSPLSLAERVYVPTSFAEQPAKVTTPLNWVAVQFDKTAPFGPVPIDRVTEANALVTMLPLASSTATTGWKPNGVPTVEVLVVGETMNASWVAGPATGIGRTKGSSTTKLKGELTTPDGEVTVIVINKGELIWGEVSELTVHAPNEVEGTNEGGFVVVLQ
jgi:hypothetical protein